MNTSPQARPRVPGVMCHIRGEGEVSTLCLGRLWDLSLSPELMGLEKRPRNSSWSEAMN